jgi:hypothetical protein
MYLLWKRSENGNLLLGKEGLRNFIAGILPSGYICEDVSLSPDSDEVTATIVLPDIYSDLEVGLIEEKICNFFEPTGLSPRITWGRKPELHIPFAGYIKKTRPLVTGVAIAGLVALFHLGITGTLKVLLSGVIAGGVVYLFLDPGGKRTLKSLKDNYWR